MVVLGVSDPREMMPALLASLPGTLQTMINTAITVARARAANPQQGGANPPGAGPGLDGPGMMASRGGSSAGPGMPPRMRSGGGGGPGSGFGGAAAPGGPGTDGNNAPAIPADAMVELKVDSDKLPKADDLRSRYFLSTLAVTVNDQDIRIVTREAFLSQYDLVGLGGFTALLLPAVQAARDAALRAQAANEQAAGGQAPAAGPGEAGAAGPGRPGAAGPGMPGMQGGRRGPRGRGPGG
jgi:hypothetical protein